MGLSILGMLIFGVEISLIILVVLQVVLVAIIQTQ